MAKALRLVSLERGRDPRDFTLIAFGGTGPAHAAALAAELRIPEVIIPRHPAVFSAWGMATADLRVDRVQTLVLPMEEPYLVRINDAWRELEREARAALRHEGVRRPVLYRQAAMRYAGQEHTVTVPATAGSWTPAHLRRMVNRFHQAHRRRYGFRLDAPVELVRLHVTALVTSGRRLPASLTAGSGTEAGGGRVAEAFRGHRRCLLQSGWHEVPVFERDLLPPGAELEGPALIEEPATVTVVHPGQRVRVDALGNLWIATGV